MMMMVYRQSSLKLSSISGNKLSVAGRRALSSLSASSGVLSGSATTVGQRQERLVHRISNKNHQHFVWPIDKPFLSNSMTLRNMSTSADPVDYLCVHVFVTCKPGTEQDFLEASLANARESSKEEGISRFDVVQQIDDPTKFVLIEVYKNGDAPAAHKETEHYLKWRDTVADMMAAPRSALKYKNHFPAVSGGWDYPEGGNLE